MANIKKENEVTKVTNLGDNDCIRATLENGQSVSIKKSDLMPIIKDEIGKLLGNSDALSTFTNVLVNNGQTLGKATIENLASVVSGIYSEIKGVWLQTPKYVYIAGSSNYDAFVVRVSGWCSSYLVDFTYYVNLETRAITRINNGVNTQVSLYIKNDATGICIATYTNSNLFVGCSAKNSLRVSDILETNYTVKQF